MKSSLQKLSKIKLVSQVFRGTISYVVVYDGEFVLPSFFSQFFSELVPCALAFDTRRVQGKNLRFSLFFNRLSFLESLDGLSTLVRFIGLANCEGWLLGCCRVGCVLSRSLTAL